MKVFWNTILFVLAIAAFGFMFRYDYRVTDDVNLKTPVLNDVSLENEVHRPIRFDRWTGKVEIYLHKGTWSDLAEWNKEKYQSIQSSVRELSSAG